MSSEDASPISSAESIAKAVCDGDDGYENMVNSMDKDMAVAVFNTILSYALFDEDGNYQNPFDLLSDDDTCDRLSTVITRMEETQCDVKKINIEHYFEAMPFLDFIPESLRDRIGKEWFSDGKYFLRGMEDKGYGADLMYHIRKYVKMSDMSTNVQEQILEMLLRMLKGADHYRLEVFASWFH